jgi:hypothetical protein
MQLRKSRNNLVIQPIYNSGWAQSFDMAANSVYELGFTLEKLGSDPASWYLASNGFPFYGFGSTDPFDLRFTFQYVFAPQPFGNFADPIEIYFAVNPTQYLLSDISFREVISGSSLGTTVAPVSAAEGNTLILLLMALISLLAIRATTVSEMARIGS